LTRSIGAAAVLDTAAETPPTAILVSNVPHVEQVVVASGSKQSSIAKCCKVRYRGQEADHKLLLTQEVNDKALWMRPMLVMCCKLISHDGEICGRPQPLVQGGFEGMLDTTTSSVVLKGCGTRELGDSRHIRDCHMIFLRR